MEQYNSYGDTLMAELDGWAKLEQTMHRVDPQSLKDSRYLSMKLRELEKLYRRFNGRVITRDEQAMFIVLRNQRSKVEKALYPGLITRLLSRAVRAGINRLRAPSQVEENNAYQPIQSYHRQTSFDAEGTAAQQKRHYGHDLGRRSNNQSRGQGQHM